MNAALEGRADRRLRLVSQMGTYAVLAFSCVALAGWFLDLPVLTSIRAGLASTSVATALCFMLSAFSVWSSIGGQRKWPGRDVLCRGSAALVIVVALYALAGYGLGQADAGYLLGRDLGRVSPATALSFILLAAALLGIEWGRGRLGVGIATLGLIIIGLDLVGYAYGIEALYRVMPFSAMALPTALAFAILFVALLLAHPGQGWVQYAVRDDRIGVMFRLLLPAIIVIPFALTYITSRAIQLGLFEPPFAFAIITVGTTVLLGALVCLLSAWLARVDVALHKAEDEVRRNARLLDAAIGVARLGAWVSSATGADDMDGQLELSDETFRIFGLDPETFDGRFASVVPRIHPDDQQAVIDARRLTFERSGPSRVAYRAVRPDGVTRWIQQQSHVQRDEHGVATRVVGMLQDVTEQRLVEQQLVQAQKMEAVGNLTGGMAHDFNNLLGIIIGNLDLLEPHVRPGTEAADFVQSAIDAALRGADLTRRLLAFARRQPLQPQRVEPNELVSGIVKLLSRTLGETVEIELDLAPDVSPIVVDPAQLEASIANLANNARDAMPKGGRLMISTANQRLDADYASNHAELVPGDYVMIAVRDTGTGMPPEVAARVFDPFFTTKEKGKGTGLGLSMVFGFMKQSGGHINLYSEPGAGTIFRLYLPCSDASTAEAQVPVAARPVGGKDTILAVEDNAVMRRTVVRQLTDLGYRVFEADSGAAALDILAKEKIDLMFTDVIMPGGIDGVDLANRAMKKWPALKIVLTSGFPETRLDGYDGAAEGLRLLSKPYRRDDLARMLREVLDA